MNYAKKKKEAKLERRGYVKGFQTSTHLMGYLTRDI
jgi:hypothetical protein